MDLENSRRPAPNPPSEEEAADYCRQIESYLCRKNDGHLIRIVGPAFDQVCGWAARGVPLKVACSGIDRYFERYYAKGPRRRPVRIEFCEADVLDVFDQWRRAVGVPPRGVATAGEMDAWTGAADRSTSPEHAGRRQSLPLHLGRVITRLTALRAGEGRPLDGVIDDVVRELDVASAAARAGRGAAREHLLERLRALDASLIAAARACFDAETMRRLGEEADAELAPFRERMPREAYEQSRRACIDRLVRDLARLPVLTFD